MKTILGIALVAVGAAACGIGAWSVANARRPAWLSARTIPSATVRIWGAGTAVAGLGVALFGADQLVLLNGGVGLAAFILVVGGAGMVTVASPRRRRQR